MEETIESIFAMPVWIYASHFMTWTSIALIAFLFKSRASAWVNLIFDRTQVGTTDLKQDRLAGMGAGFCLFSILMLMEINLLFSLLCAIAAFVATPIIVRKRRFVKYQKSFDASLVESLATVSSSLRAGLTLKDALVVAVQNCPEVFSAEIARVLKDYRFGQSIDSALDGVRRRVKTPNANIAFGALIIGTQLGGRIPEVLNRIVTTIREVDRVEGRLKALTAQGRAQGALLCSMPIIITIGLYFTDREKIEFMLTAPLGKLMTGIAVFLEVIGVLVTLKVMKLDV
jgi:tight adherence protein B